MSVWSALVVMTFAALGSTSWLATRSIAHVANRRRASAEQLRGRPNLRQGCWAAYAATATGIGAATGHPFAAAIFLVPAISVEHLCVRLWGGSAETATAPTQETDSGDAGDSNQALHDSWREALGLGVDAAIVGLARERCDSLLEAHRADPLDLALLDWAVFLRRRVPDLVAACRDEVGMHEDVTLRTELLRQFAETLDAIGFEAARRRGSRRVVAHHRFELARNHALERVAETRSHP